MNLYGHEKVKYNVPLNHLDHAYVKECSDVKELEKILKILRSGKEGVYVDLEKITEQQIARFDPKNKLLRKPDRLLNPQEVSEWKGIEEGLHKWQSEMQKVDLTAADPINDCPIRTTCTYDGKTDKEGNKENAKPNKVVKPRDYKEWDKLNIDEELEKVDKKEEKKIEKEKVDEQNDDTNIGLNKELNDVRGEREKNKGNEAFKSGDYEEAIKYYSRSLNLSYQVATINNRALTYLKVKDWNKAYDDCCEVLKNETCNIKALLRRATAQQNLARYPSAVADLTKVLQAEPTNKQAQTMMRDIRKVVGGEDGGGDKKKSGKKMVIEEVEENNNEISKAKEIVVEGGDNGKLSQDNKKSQVSVKSNQKQNKNKKEVSSDVLQETSQIRAKQNSAKIELSKLLKTARELKKIGQYGNAIELFTRVINSAPKGSELGEYHFERGMCKLKEGDCRGCIADCDLSLQFSPNSQWCNKAIYHKAMAYEQLEKYRDAYVGYKMIFHEANAMQGASRCAKHLQEMDGSNWRNKVSSLSSQASTNTCNVDANEKIKNDLSSIQKPGKKMNSKQKEQTESSKDPQHLDSSSNVQVSVENKKRYDDVKNEGSKFFKDNNLKEAVRCFSECIEIDNTQTQAFTNRALCFLKLNKPNEVFEDCNEALLIDIHNIKALFRRALAYKMQGRYEESLIDLQTLLKIDPENKAAKKEIVCVEKEKDKKTKMAALRNKHEKVRHKVDIKIGKEVPCQTSKIDSRNIKSDDAEKVSGQENVSSLENNKSKAIKNPNVARMYVVKEDITVSVKPNDSEQQQKMDFVECSSGNDVSGINASDIWRVMRQVQEEGAIDDDLGAYISFFDRLNPSSLPKLMGEQMESSHLMVLVACVRHYLRIGNAPRALQMLDNLMKVPRFDMQMMFLGSSCKHNVSLMLEESKKHLDEELYKKLQIKLCL